MQVRALFVKFAEDTHCRCGMIPLICAYPYAGTRVYVLMYGCMRLRRGGVSVFHVSIKQYRKWELPL